MKTRHSWNFCLLLNGIAALCCSRVGAQIIFSIADLPGQMGQYYRAYLGTSTGGVSNLIGQAGGPRLWDFSQPQTPNEIIRRMDVVDPADGGQGTNFPAAAYSERNTDETNNVQSWSYYRLTSGQGRNYYGFYDAVASPECPAKVFMAPTTDIPASVQFGQTWNRSVDWDDCFDIVYVIPAVIHFTAEAQVDAYGTMVLPNIGEVPALRVNEVHTYLTTLMIPLFPPITLTNHFRNYYWLVRGIGKAVDIISDSQNSVPPPELGATNYVLRVFEASRRPVADFRIRVQGGQALLDWRQQTNSSGYRVETVTDLAVTNWQVRAEPVTNAWTEIPPSNEPKRFFRVSLKP